MEYWEVLEDIEGEGKKASISLNVQVLAKDAWDSFEMFHLSVAHDTFND